MKGQKNFSIKRKCISFILVYIIIMAAFYLIAGQQLKYINSVKLKTARSMQLHATFRKIT